MATHIGITNDKNLPVDEIGERYSQIQITASTMPWFVKLYQPQIKFPRNVRLSHQRIATSGAWTF